MRINMNTVISIESFLNKGGDLMNWKDVIISSVKWALSVSIMLFSIVMVIYGAFILAAGVFKGIIGYIVLGPILLMVGLTVIHLVEILSGTPY